MSLQEPTDDERLSSESLARTIQQTRLYEDNDGVAKRKQLVCKVAKLVQKWVADTAVKQGKSNQPYGATAIAFGGHELGVVMKDSDIDIVCIVPHFVQRQDFFTTFVALLKSQSGGESAPMRLVTGARVPIIESYLDDIQIDLCLACLKLDDIPEGIDLSDDGVLKELDIVDVRGLNGIREVRNVLKIVPNVETYRSALRAIKLWAKVKGLHHSTLGYPGGIGWAIMLARISQLYPNAAPALLILKFFKIYSDWRWPTPVTLAPQKRDDPYKLKPWNPKVNPGDRHHVMPVITPAYPEKNCCSTVTKSALQLVTQQLNIGAETVRRIESPDSASQWQDLFKPIDFFAMYKHFLMLVARSSSVEDHPDWMGLVQARSRFFLEDVEGQTAVLLVHAFPKAYTEQLETKWFWGLQFTDTKGIKLSVAEGLETFRQHLTEMGRDRGIHKPGMTIECHHIKRKDLKNVLPGRAHPS